MSVLLAFQGGTVPFAGAGQFQITASLGLVATATFQGAGNLSVTASLALTASEALAGQGSLAATASLALAGVAEFDGSSTLTSVVGLGVAAFAEFDGSSVLIANMDQKFATPHFEFDGTSSLRVTVTANQIVFATFQGASNMILSPGVASQIQARFAGASTLSANAILIELTNSANFAGEGFMSVTTLASLAAAVGFSGSSTFTINVAGSRTRTSDFPISNLDWRNMAILAIATTENLFYDVGNTESFYVLVSASPPPVLHAVSPAFAATWFGLLRPSQVIYNPFTTNPTFPLSNLV